MPPGPAADEVHHLEHFPRRVGVAPTAAKRPTEGVRVKCLEAPLYLFFVHDRPGSFGRLTQLVGGRRNLFDTKSGVNIPARRMSRIETSFLAGPAGAEALLGIGLPVTLVSADFLLACDRRLTLIQGDEDAFGPLPLVMALASRLPGGARVVAIPGAAHDFAGRLDELARRTGESIPERLRPPRPPGAPIGDDPSGVIS